MDFDSTIFKALASDNHLARDLLLNPSFIMCAGEELLKYTVDCFLACPQAGHFFIGSAAGEAHPVEIPFYIQIFRRKRGI